MNKVTQVPYLAIAVKDLEKASRFFGEKFGGVISEIGGVPSESYRDVVVQIGDFHLYLMEPTSEESVIAKYIAKHGEGIHHVCFCYPNYKEAVAKLREENINILDRTHFSFIHPKDAYGVLIELAPENNEPRAQKN
ncbi:VOC family protein [Neobacillus sp. 114]|uniref:VOC family protein n=1 Tax=Neobacillus sp. 114 TaxID=3048535 RepID=UPI0024C2EC7A|nr:VOC family protein [Neobacillus sp. 114]